MTCDDRFGGGVLALSTVVVVLVCLCMLCATFGFAWRHSHTTLKKMFNPMERRFILVQYLFVIPLFEIVVVWGTHSGVLSDESSGSSIVTWILFNMWCLVLLVVALFSGERYRFVVHMQQCMRFPVALMFFCDRFYNAVMGVEGAIISCMIMCSFFEVLGASDYCSNLPPVIVDAFGIRADDDNGYARRFPDASIAMDPFLMSDNGPNLYMDGEDSGDDSQSIVFGFDDRATTDVISQMNAQRTARVQTRIMDQLSKIPENITPREAYRLTMRLRQKAAAQANPLYSSAGDASSVSTVSKRDTGEGSF